MKEIQNKVAVVTGAASGIGKALALNLAKEDVKLALMDVDSEGLNELQSLLNRDVDECYAESFDVSDQEAFRRFAENVINHYQNVDILINNAGVSLSGTVYDLTYPNFEWIMNINFWGTVYGTKAFLPHLLTRPQANVVNTSSVYGLIGVPAQAAYCASKFAVRGFTETLRVELYRTHVKVSVVYPGGVMTDIAKNSRSDSGFNTPERIAEFEKSLKTSADEAARTIIEGIKSDSPRILIGQDARDIDMLSRFQPDDYDAKVWESIDA